MAPELVSLSKTLFQAGLQCRKRLWLQRHRRELAAPLDLATRARLRMGHRVGALARERWPGGVLVREPAARHARAVARTRELLAADDVPAVFEAALEFEGVRIRADAIVKHAGGLELVEVKSSSRVKSEHTGDVAVQLYVAEGAGLDVARVGLMHLNTGYVWAGGPYDVGRLFTLDDMTAEARSFLPEVGRVLPSMRESLAAVDPPEVAIGRHCTRPYACPFERHCWRAAPQHPVTDLPSASGALLDALAADGITDLRDIPAGRYSLSAVQERVRASAAAGEADLARERLQGALSALEHPLTFLDFETFMPVLPLYHGTHPYEIVPFQWSAHVEAAEGDVEHHEFLWTGRDDPRPHFVRSLLAALPPRGSIVVYSPYEETCLRTLATSFPDEGAPLLASFLARAVDLNRIVRACVYHPDFHGSFSLKRVLPVLVPGLGYEGMAIGDGLAAAAAYAELVDPATGEDRREWIERSLRAYCRLDTLAEMRLLERLTRL